MIVRKRPALSVAAAVFAAATFVWTPAPAAARNFALADLQTIVGVTSPAISPDGKRAVVVVSRVDWKSDKMVRDLDLVDLTTHARRTLTYERLGLTDPAWSPDGSKLAFLASVDKHAQIFVMPMDGGDARPVTKAPEGVEQFAWRPDGAAFAYAAADAVPKRSGADQHRDAFVFTTEPITARSPSRPVHLWTVPAAGGTAHQVTKGPESVATGEAQSTLSWSADGTQIAFTLTPNAILNDAFRGRVAVVDVAAGAPRRLTPHTGYESQPLFSPDGKQLAYLHSAGDNQITLTEAYVTNAAGGEGIAVSHPFDRAVRDLAWLPDGGGIVFASADGTGTAVVRAAGGTLTRTELGELAVASPLRGALARDGGMVFTASTTTQPAELYYKAPNAAPVRVTDYNHTIAALDLATSETVTFATSLGVQGDAVLLKPPGYVAGKRYPLALVIHGGPTSASLRSFDRLGQLMAARGWLVLEPNYRGSDNLGYTYQHAVQYDPDEGPGRDVMAAVDAVRARGIVDDHRIVVGGWSYGGIMTAWMISKYHIWRAAVSGASVNDWITDYGIADDSDSDKALFHGSPFVAANAAEWRKASAITYARDVTTPVLILSDIGDNRDPFATSSMYYRALRDNGKDATLVAWPVDGHFPRDPVRTSDVYGRWIQYLADHLR